MTDHNNPPAPVAGDTGADAGPVATVFLKENGQYGIMWLRPVPFVEGKAALFAGPDIHQPAAVPDGWRDELSAIVEILEADGDEWNCATRIRAMLSAAPVPPSVPGATVYAECRQCDHCGHYGINDCPGEKAACHNCDWTGDSPEQDKCPGCGEENCMAAACPKCGERYSLVAEDDIAAPVPPIQADPVLDKPAMVGRGRFGVGVKWSTVIGAAQRLYEYEVTPSKEKVRIKLAQDAMDDLRQFVGVAAADVLAERKRQLEVEGWTPEHDDEHGAGELGRAGGFYALNAGAALHFGTTDTSICDQAPSGWPWEPEWWKPKNSRHDLVKAGALILAEIERLDRAAMSATPEAPQ